MLMLDIPALRRSVRVRRWFGRQRIDAVSVGEGGRAREGGVRCEIMDSRVVSLWLKRGRRERRGQLRARGASNNALTQRIEEEGNSRRKIPVIDAEASY